MKGGKISSYKYSLPKKVLLFSESATVKAKYETDDNGTTRFVGNANVTLNNDLKLVEQVEPNESYYVITENITKSLDQLSLDMTFYPNGVLKGVNAETYNSGVEIAEGVFTAVTSLARSAFCSFPFGPKGAVRDTTFKISFEKSIDFEPGRYADTISLAEWLPTTNNAFITISLKDTVSYHDGIDSINNGFVYCNPKWIHTEVKFHNYSTKQTKDNQELSLAVKSICYPQFGRLHVLVLPRSTVGAGIKADFTEDGILTGFSYFRNKDAAAKMQSVNALSQQVPTLIKDIYSTQKNGSDNSTDGSTTKTKGK